MLNRINLIFSKYYVAMKKYLMLFVLLFPVTANAGMPTITLTDVAKFHLDSISFFLMLILLATWGVKLLWNYLRCDFEKMPYLTYKMALVLVFSLSLLFNLLLLMIAGARELMTPDAWVKQGVIYKVKK